MISVNSANFDTRMQAAIHKHFCEQLRSLMESDGNCSDPAASMLSGKMSSRAYRK